MCFLQKSEYKEYMMDFSVLRPDEVTSEGMGVEFVAFASINGKAIYCYALYRVPAKTPEEYAEMIRELLNYNGKQVKVKLKFKKDKIKNFKIDVSSFADVYQNERLGKLELLGWGLHDSWPA